jgi:hypothetical protein
MGHALCLLFDEPLVLNLSRQNSLVELQQNKDSGLHAEHGKV